LKCPHCGAKLKIAEGMVILACQHCGSASEFTRESAIRLEQSIIAANGQQERYLPFWLVDFNAKVTGLSVHAPQSAFRKESSDAPLAKDRTNAGDIALPSRMLVAAFRVNNFINYTADLSHQLSLRLDRDLEMKPVEKPMEYGLCYYGHLDAQGMVEVLLRVMANKKSRDILDIELDIVWGPRRVIWWPFIKDGDCWRDMIHGQRLLQSALQQ